MAHMILIISLSCLLLHLVDCRFYKEDDFETWYQKRDGSNNLDDAEAEEYLRAHNDWRRGVDPPASDMLEVVYDEELAQLAQSWTDECIYDHPKAAFDARYKNTGNNLYTKTGATMPTPQRVVDAWGGEVNNYDYYGNGGGSCIPGKVCGHYTQVVWSKVTRIGCGATFCPVMEGGRPNSWLIMCNYDPPANLGGRKPYTEGSPGSACRTGTSLNGLCTECTAGADGCECNLSCQNCGTLDSSTCSCACPTGYLGPVCNKICQDIGRNCKRLPKSLCNKGDVQLRKKQCPAKCGVCEAPTGTPTC